MLHEHGVDKSSPLLQDPCPTTSLLTLLAQRRLRPSTPLPLNLVLPQPGQSLHLPAEHEADGDDAEAVSEHEADGEVGPGDG
ncbi:hypothetical protein CDD80_5132 [Ophiocordyceps camponoti-rufipedis]|uniref:Uncharacterized protein n=1 Tax=Ophiocordyceps camponoti-rufipedis TaxID=2004952 RepID=A0A2C5XGH7_9HYPO|nr:hypothetical protein CDD80_5132 [Ophiocordyceps camponoti-rufipedis]